MRQSLWKMQSKRRETMVRARFGMITLFLILVTVYSVEGIGAGRGNRGRIEVDRHYEELEKEFLERARATLDEQGYHNCGVTMTRVTGADGRREYTVLLHHKRFGQLGDQELSKLAGALSGMDVQDGIGTFVVAVW